MMASRRPRVVPRLIQMASSGAVALALIISGCGTSADTPQELSPEAKKSLTAGKIGDPSKFIKPKAVGGRRR